MWLQRINSNQIKQDLVFSVKLQFGKTKNKYKFQEKFLLQKIVGPKNLSLWKKKFV